MTGHAATLAIDRAGGSVADPDPWACYYGQPLIAVVDDLWRQAVARSIAHHAKLRRWQNLRAQFGSRVPTPPTGGTLALLFRPSWWTQVDAQTITPEAAPPALDPLGRYLASHDPQTLRWLPAVAQEIAHIRPVLFTEAVAGLIQAIADGAVQISGIADLANHPDGPRRLLPSELMRGRCWVLRRDGCIVIQHAPEGTKLVYAAARLEPASSELPFVGVTASEHTRPAPAKPTPRKPPGINYEEADTPLLVEMKNLLESRQAKSIWEAARMVAPRAIGSTHGDSRAKRLADHFKSAYPEFSRVQG